MMSNCLVGKLKGLFGGAASSAESTDAESSDSAVPSPSPLPSSEDKKQQGKEKDQNTIRLKVEFAPLSIVPMTLAEKRTARDR